MMAVLFKRFGAVLGADDFNSLLRSRHRETLKVLVSSGCFGQTTGLSSGGLVYPTGLCEGGMVYAAERGDLATCQWLLDEAQRGDQMPVASFFQALLWKALRAQSHHIIKVGSRAKFTFKNESLPFKLSLEI